MSTLHDRLRENVGLGALEDAEADRLDRRAHEAARHEDAPESDDERYAIYRWTPGDGAREHHRLAETSLEGIGLTLRTLRDEGEITGDTRVGIFDRQERTWIINPWAAGRP